MGNFQPTPNRISGEQFSSYKTANATGGGLAGAAGVTTYVEKKNGQITTTILVDIEGLLVSGTTRDVIGDDGAAASYLTQITTAVNGIIYKAHMGCTETPAGSNVTADIDLATSTDSLAEDARVSTAANPVYLISAGGAMTVNMGFESAQGLDLTNCVNSYLYLVNGSGANSGGTYTAGKLIIKLYGASF